LKLRLRPKNGCVFITQGDNKKFLPLAYFDVMRPSGKFKKIPEFRE
jgi:hypothetical protein